MGQTRQCAREKRGGASSNEEGKQPANKSDDEAKHPKGHILVVGGEDGLQEVQRRRLLLTDGDDAFDGGGAVVRVDRRET